MDLQKDEVSRYVRIPTPLRKERNLRRKSFSLKSLITIHKNSIEREKQKLGINNYWLLWISFARGAIVAILIDRLIFH